jgi:hypothetical protein
MGQSIGGIKRFCPFTKVRLFVVPNVYSNCIDCRAKIALICSVSRYHKNVKSGPASKLARAFISLARLAIVRE